MSTSQIIRPLHPPPAAPRAAPATGHAGTRAAQWIQRLAVPLLVLLQVLLSLRLGNTAFEDEALYVQASLACVVVAMLCVRATARHLFGRTAGDLAALAFAVTGPVVFVSALATFDALCLLLLALALYLGVTRRSYPSAAVAGLALAAAAVVVSTCSRPSMSLVTAGTASRRPPLRRQSTHPPRSPWRTPRPERSRAAWTPSRWRRSRAHTRSRG